MNNLLLSLKEQEQDFEWYPTTNEMLNVIKSDIEEEFYNPEYLSILDCGAGDGRALEYLTKGSRYAIEKSSIHVENMHPSIIIAGSDFKQQTLIDKKTDIIFCNPPYSEYEEWAIKIIEESFCKVIYLVIPKRWKKNNNILNALKYRNANYKIIHSGDFLNAERQARAEIDVIRIEITKNHNLNSNYGHIDPFENWFNSNFKFESKEHILEEFDEIEFKNEMVSGKKGIIDSLVLIYNNELDILLNTYKDITKINYFLLKEIGIKKNMIMESLKTKIKNLKEVYWKRIFDNLDKITEKLTYSNRNKLFETLTNNTHIDFTKNNIYSVVIWVIKNSNYYFDEQLIDVVERLVGESNIILYKSNKKTFGDEEWLYNRKPKTLDYYGLDYRIVVSCGGLYTGDWNSDLKKYNGLTLRAKNMIDDLCVVANYLGFESQHKALDFDWTIKGKKEFLFKDLRKQNDKLYTLFEAKAFYNGNMHFKLNQKFIQRLNIEFGKLKGWLKHSDDAVNELNINKELAERSFNETMKLEINNVKLLNNF